MGTKISEKVFGKTHPTLPDDLRHLWGLLDIVRKGVVEVHDSLPAAPEESTVGDMGSQEPVAMRVRSDLRCLLTDSIEPGLRALSELADSLAEHIAPLSVMTVDRPPAPRRHPESPFSNHGTLRTGRARGPREKGESDGKGASDAGAEESPSSKAQ